MPLNLLRHQSSPDRSTGTNLLRHVPPEEAAGLERRSAFRSLPGLNLDVEAENDRLDFRLRLSLSDVLKVSPQRIDLSSGANLADRWMAAGLDSDTEIKKWFAKEHPDGWIDRVKIPQREGEHLDDSYLVFKYNTANRNEDVKAFNDEGLSYADGIAGVREIGLPGAAALSVTPFTGPMGAGGRALITGIAGWLGELAEQKIQNIQGFQGDSTQRQFQRALGAGTFESIAGGSSKFVDNRIAGLMGGGGENRFSAQAHDFFERLERHFPDQSIGPMPFEMAERPLDLMGQRLGRQVTSTSQPARQRYDLRNSSAAKALVDQGATEFDDLVGFQLKELGERSIDEGELFVTETLLSNTRRATEIQAAGGISAWNKSNRDIKNEAWRRTDAVAEQGNVQVGILASLDEARDINRRVLGLGREFQQPQVMSEPGAIVSQSGEPLIPGQLMDQPPIQTPDVNVRRVPEGELGRVMSDLFDMDPENQTYDAVRSLRTRLFDLINNRPWEWDTNKFEARNLYNALTEDLKNPLGGDTTTYLASLEDSIDLTRRRFDILSAPIVRQALSRSPTRDNTGALVIDIAGPNLQTRMAWNLISDDLKEDVRYGILTKIGTEERPMDAFRAWRRKDPESFTEVFPLNRKDEFEDILKFADWSRNRDVAKIFREQEEMSTLASNLLDSNDRSRMRDVLLSVGGDGSTGHDLLRASVWSNLIRVGTKAGARPGSLQLDPKALRKFWDDKQTVLNEIMLPDERERIQTLTELAEYITPKSDIGASLEAAQIFTNLKHPNTFFNGVHQLAANDVLGRIMISDRAVTRLQKAVRADRRRRSRNISRGTQEAANLMSDTFRAYAATQAALFHSVMGFDPGPVGGSIPQDFEVQ